MSKATSSELTPRTVRLFSICGAVVVANLYYNQPLLSAIARDFRIGAALSGTIPALTQAGYACGLFLLVPLADFLNPRRLVALLTTIAGVALAVAAMAPNIFVLQVASFGIGLFSVVPQILVPIAASMSAPSERGRNLGRMMAGLLTGVLLSRTVSGYIARYFGWRAAFATGAVLMIAALVFEWLFVPSRDALERPRYGAVLRSLVELARTHHVLRETSFIGAMCFGAFSAFWSTLAFFLAGPPWHLSSDIVGLFGVVGLAGVAAAPIVGRMSDRRSPRATAAYAIAIMLLSFGVFALGARSMPALVAGVILLDLGVQSALARHASTRFRPRRPGD
jgi:predicted MFS family arabinose efflux permease